MATKKETKVVEETKVEETTPVKKVRKSTKKTPAKEEVKTEVVNEEKVATAEKAPKASKAKKVSKVEETKPVSKATIHDFDCIIEPLITEKTMKATQDENKITFIVKKGANKTQIRNAIEKIYNVHVVGISTVNVVAKATTRGSRYKGTISGFKKAIVTIRNGESINLFAE